jgi:hypothetical protein
LLIELAKPDSNDDTWLVIMFNASANEYSTFVPDLTKIISSISPPIPPTDNSNTYGTSDIVQSLSNNNNPQ